LEQKRHREFTSGWSADKVAAQAQCDYP
jgi:hypothetical protein